MTQTDSFAFGIPIDSSDTQTSRTGEAHYRIISIVCSFLDWLMFAAACTSDLTLRDALITHIHAYASSTLGNQPFEVVYNPLTGDQIAGSSRFGLSSLSEL